MATLKNDQNKYLLGSLFREIAPDTRYVIFSLHDDIEGLTNARRTFVDLEDPTGYLWSKRHLGGSYEHWTRLMACKWFQDAYHEWMEELTAKLRARSSEGIRVLTESPDTPDAVRLAALKYLHGETKPGKRKAGAPSKEEIRGEMQRALRDTREVQEDMERIGLKVV